MEKHKKEFKEFCKWVEKNLRISCYTLLKLVVVMVIINFIISILLFVGLIYMGISNSNGDLLDSSNYRTSVLSSHSSISEMVTKWSAKKDDGKKDDGKKDDGKKDDGKKDDGKKDDGKSIEEVVQTLVELHATGDVGSQSILVVDMGVKIENIPFGVEVELVEDPNVDPSVEDIKGEKEVKIKDKDEDVPIAEITIDFDEADTDIDLGDIVAEVDLENQKSVIHDDDWPSEVDISKTLYIPSTGKGHVYICPNAASLVEVKSSCENKVKIKVGETVNGMTVTEEYINGERFYVVTGITGTGGGEGGIVREQLTSGGNGGATGSVSATWAAPTTAGNLLVAIVSAEGGTDITFTPPSVDWDLARRGNKSTKVANAIYYIENAGSQSGISTWGISPNKKAAVVLIEYSGVVATSALDVTATANAKSASADSGLTATTTQADAVAVASLSVKNIYTFSNQTNGFTEVGEYNSGSDRINIAFEEKLLTTIGQQQVEATLSASKEWAGVIAVFKEAIPADPVANDDADSTDEDVAVAIDVPANDTDDGTLDLTTVTIVTPPTNGGTAVNPTTGVVTYTPNADYNGGDFFTYTINDDQANTSNVGTVTITVNSMNDDPVANDDADSTDENVGVAIDVPANDTDSDGTLDLTTVTIVAPASNGGTVVNPTTGVVTYTPDTDYNGGDSFTYTIDDNEAGTSNTATVTLTVNSVNAAPVANDDVDSTNEDVAVQIDVPVNDTDGDGTLDLTTVIVTSGPTNGGTVVNPTTGVVTYTPNADYNGGDSFTYTINDNLGATSNTATVTLTVNSLNDDPVANDDADSTNEDFSVAIDVPANDTDSDGTLDLTTVTIVTPATNGGTVVNPTTGVVTYTPNADYNGGDSFTYTIDDNLGATSNVATVTLTVNSVNDDPVANADADSTDENVGVAIDVPANDTDSDGTLDLTTVTIVAPASNGGTVVNPTTGVVTYTPDTDYNGGDSFTYTIDDNEAGTSNTATVTLTVNSVNDDPVANDDADSTDENVAVAIDVPANDTDSDGTLDLTTVTIVAPASNGGTAVNPTTGVVTYTPNADYNGGDSFTYTIDDNEAGTSNAATVTLTVNSVNAAPVANDDVDSTNEDVAVQIDVPVNDTDGDGTLDLTTVIVTSGPTNGGTVVNPTTGVVTYTPNADYNGGDSFTYTINDNLGATSNTATVNITVNSMNDNPVANADADSTNEDFSVAIDVPANDTDSDGTLDLTTVTIVAPASNGGTAVNPTTGVVTYTPNADYNGGDSFTYTIDDNEAGTSNTATVTLTVNSVNDDPVANDDVDSTNEDFAVVIDVPANDTDSDGTLDLTSVVIVAAPTNGGMVVNPTTGVVTYTPNADYNGGDSFTYTINDNLGATSNTATVTLTINSVNDNPAAIDDADSTNEDTAVAIDVPANDIDIDGTLDLTLVVVASGPTYGGTAVNPTTGVVTYTPNADYNGLDSFTYTIDDNEAGTSNAGTVNLTVNSVNDDPVANNDSASTNKNVAVEIEVPANDTDVDGTLDLTSVLVTSGPTNGGVLVNLVTGAVTYTPDTGYTGADSFTYTIDDDSAGTSNAGTVSITVNSVGGGGGGGYAPAPASTSTASFSVEQPSENEDFVEDALLEENENTDSDSCLEYDPDRQLVFTDLADVSPQSLALVKYVEFLKGVKLHGEDQYLISGYGSTDTVEGEALIGPFDFISRLGAVKIALTSNCITIYDEVPLDGEEFTDLPREVDYPNSWYPDVSEEDLMFATRVMYTGLDNEVIQGYGKSGAAAPWEISTRAEIIKMFVNSAGLGPDELKKNSTLWSLIGATTFGWNDVSPDDWFYDFVKVSRYYNLMNDSTFLYPNRSATRADLFTLVTRVMYVVRHDVRDIIVEEFWDQAFVQQKGGYKI